MIVMGLAFLVGLAFLLNNNTRKKGIILAGIPSSIVIIFLVFNLFSEIFTRKPQTKDLVGTYHIVKVTQLDFDRNTYDKYKLQFFENGTFRLTPTPSIDVCQSGKYEVDYQFEYNELSLKCSNLVTSAHIDRGFGNYRIEFVIGDPDSGESIYFEKTEKEL
ncbi:hypothetical protein [Flavobacterium sp. HJJ]|uniref:hypothetical protein n=1 Tax=Flavobacterium sp. HJJ TaxID=2783792 RepID=UPI001889FD11|nr:hypothetical protein [Flavobacterium sp. HJJ]MBF4473803.1 hypothetical protein [Flavobacterium sp. HJJ]